MFFNSFVLGRVLRIFLFEVSVVSLALGLLSFLVMASTGLVRCTGLFPHRNTITEQCVDIM